MSEKKHIRIERVWVTWEPDEAPDLSFLGEYTDEYGEGYIDRQAEGDWHGNREYRYFKPSDNHFPHNPKSWSHVNRDQVREAFEKMPLEWQAKRRKYGTKIATLDAWYAWQDYQRMEAYNRGDWWMEGCTARAEISYETHGGSRRLQRFSSTGLWGIESDAGDDHKQEFQRDELSNLKRHLEVFGVDTSDFEDKLHEKLKPGPEKFSMTDSPPRQGA